MLIFYQLLPLSPLAYHIRCRCWYIRVVVKVGVFGVLSLSLFFVEVSGVPSCDCIHRLLCIVVGSVLLLLLAATSPLLKLKYPSVHKFQQVIGTNRKLFERFWAIIFSQQVPVLSNRCMFAMAKILAEVPHKLPRRAKSGTYLALTQ